MVLPMRNPISRRRNAFSLIGRYDPFMYWMMCLDTCRINAYEEAIKHYSQQIQKKTVWLDIGTGAHMPLTRLLLKYDVAEHVHAVEANRSTFQFANNLREQLSNVEKRTISLHGCHSKAVDWYAKEPRINAIIHEIVGCISSDEGCIKIMHDIIENLHGDISFCIPYQVGTLCIPVSRPNISLTSSFCSMLLSSSMRLIKNIGIQGMFNPPRDAFLCGTPQFIENFILLDYVRQPLEKCTIFQTKFAVEKNRTKWSGFYLAPYILAAKDDRTTEIDGLNRVTNWPVRYIQIFNHQDSIVVKRGDEINLRFESDITTECPTYRLEAWLNDDYFVRSSFAWKGPAIY